MNELEQITENTCVNRIYAGKLMRIPDELQECRYQCTPERYMTCERYRSIGRLQIPFRKGRLSWISL